MSRDQLYQDILSYNLSLIGCSESSSDQEIGDATGECSTDTSCPVLHYLTGCKKKNGLRLFHEMNGSLLLFIFIYLFFYMKSC